MPNKKKNIPKNPLTTILKVIVVFAIVLIITIVSSHQYINTFDRYCTYDFDEIAHNRVGLLLGTSPQRADGRDNLFFTYRINAATELFKKEKIDYILISGDNRTEKYNEPVAMQEALIENGIPDKKIVLDYAGFRTLDSVVRAKKVFGQDAFTVISQPFHNERAVFLAQKNGIDAICANAQDVPLELSPRVRIREALARVKVLLDVYVLNTEPKFLGEKINIE